MKHSYLMFIYLSAFLWLPSCVPADITVTLTSMGTQLPLDTPVHPTSMPIPSPALSKSATPLLSLEPGQARKSLKTLLQEPIDCAAPCFWGIVPGQTSLDEALSIFSHFGLEVKSTTINDKDFYGSRYYFENGLGIDVILTVTDGIVRNLRLKINPEEKKAGVPRGWLAYSPETLIQRYGSPSKVFVFVGRAGPNPSYGVTLYFDSLDLIVEYFSYDLAPNLGACPLSDQFVGVDIWMGKNPIYPPLVGVPLEEATSMTMDEFSSLMTRDPENACLNFNEEMFP